MSRTLHVPAALLLLLALAATLRLRGNDYLLPLFVALGAAGACAEGHRLVAEVTYGVVAMDAYVFEPTAQAAAVS